MRSGKTHDNRDNFSRSWKTIFGEVFVFYSSKITGRQELWWPVDAQQSNRKNRGSFSFDRLLPLENSCLFLTERKLFSIIKKMVILKYRP